MKFRSAPSLSAYTVFQSWAFRASKKRIACWRGSALDARKRSKAQLPPPMRSSSRMTTPPMSMPRLVLAGAAAWTISVLLTYRNPPSVESSRETSLLLAKREPVEESIRQDDRHFLPDFQRASHCVWYDCCFYKRVPTKDRGRSKYRCNSGIEIALQELFEHHGGAIWRVVSPLQSNHRFAPAYLSARSTQANGYYLDTTDAGSCQRSVR